MIKIQGQTYQAGAIIKMPWNTDMMDAIFVGKGDLNISITTKKCIFKANKKSEGEVSLSGIAYILSALTERIDYLPDTGIKTASLRITAEGIDESYTLQCRVNTTGMSPIGKTLHTTNNIISDKNTPVTIYTTESISLENLSIMIETESGEKEEKQPSQIGIKIDYDAIYIPGIENAIAVTLTSQNNVFAKIQYKEAIAKINYINGCGAIETIAITGAITVSTERYATPARHQDKIISSNIEIKTKYKIDTGYIRQSELIQYRELLSTSLGWITYKNVINAAVCITEANDEEINDKSVMPRLELTMESVKI